MYQLTNVKASLFINLKHGINNYHNEYILSEKYIIMIYDLELSLSLNKDDSNTLLFNSSLSLC